MGKPHVLMVPFPVQGHVIPMFELAYCLAKHRIRTTIVNTEIVHHRLLNSTSALDDSIRLVSVPDGLESGERQIPGKLMEAVCRVMPVKIEELIREIGGCSAEDKVSCIVYDQSLGRIQQVAERMGIGSVAFLPAAAALLVLGFNIPKLIQDGIIDDQGNPLTDKAVQFAATMPIMSPSDFVWHRLKIASLQKLLFHIMTENNTPTESADWLICNSVLDLEPGAFTMAPQILPIGPLLATNNRPAHSAGGHFWQQEYECLEWLDRQPPCSVIYVAFGSSVMLKKAHVKELALGLELANRPFLWVVRPEAIDGADDWEEFLERVAGRGRIIGWAPQQRVLEHPSTACFISHCGWNSTLESVSSGVPMLCWPYFADQFINQSYVCDIWKVGLRLEEDGANGIVASEEINRKIDRLLGDGAFRGRALHLKGKVWSSAREGGHSHENLSKFINWIKK
ncbi:UDP-glycosyltransferase 83A1-like isoform X1 [Sesamum indicum]|uniref:Glycosyltransferase n=1 Tax=Sesamum indicum TaxID=4182 RepID=A0A6I9TQQ6_SESIN|nr:UDP-glycosyltransferase 83A1-like isoform X1 [Sesamum indicum]